MQEVNENEMMQQYMRSPSHDKDNPRHRQQEAPGFHVREAPWSPATAPDTASTTDFPGLAPSAASMDGGQRYVTPVTWGPKIKR